MAAGTGLNLFGSQKFDFSVVGQFGDAFGGLSGFMASIAAAGAWYAVALQRAEISRQQTDRKEDEKRNHQEAFEHNFFQLLQHLTSIVRETEFRNGSFGRDEIFTGKDAFGKMLKALRSSIWFDSSLGSDLKDIEKTYTEFYNNLQDDLGHYFRFLFHIVNYVHASRDVDRGFYMKLLFAQLSNSELILLAYNCALGRGQTRFKPLIEEYSGLTNIGFERRGYAYEETLFREHFEAATLPPMVTSISEDILAKCE